MKPLVLQLMLLALLLAACAGPMAKTQNASQEWRLQTLEERFLDFQEDQRREAERAKTADEALAKKLAQLEERVSKALYGGADLPEETTVKAESMMETTATEQPMAEAAKPAAIEPEEPMQAASAPEAAEETAPDAEPVPDPAPDVASVEAPAPVMAGPESDEERPWANVPGPAVAPSVPGPAVRTDTRKPVPAQPVIASAQSQYDRGLGLVRAHRPDVGREVLEGFLQNYPSHKLVPNAMYWIGEAYYEQKDYPQAILSFKDVVAKYPKHHKAQAALLKIGMSYQNVGDKDNALFYLRTLVEDYPNSDPARAARQLLREIPN